LIECVPMPPLSAEDIELITIMWLRDSIPEHLIYPGKLTLGRIEQILAHDLDYSIQLIDEQPLGISAQTDFADRIIMITPQLYDKLENGEGYALFTLAHEIAHILMHAGYVLKNLSKVARSIRVSPQEIKTYMSSEWQAEHGSGAILMPMTSFVPFVKQLKEKQYALQDIIKIVAEKYGVTEKAARARINAVNKDNLSNLRLLILTKTA